MTVLLVVFAITLVIGLPIAFSMCFATGAALVAGNFNLIVLTQKLLTGMDSLPLLAVPGFILAGELMTKGGMASRLIRLAKTLIGHRRNGLSIVTIVTGMFFSAMNGVAAATTAAIGEIMIPEMKKDGYDPAYVAGLSAVVGPLGPIIPPSVIMIIYAVGGNLSVGDMFMGGIIPGIILGLMLILCSFYLTRNMNLRVEEKATFKEFWAAFKESIWALICPLIVLGGIYGGVFTPTEASVVAVFYSIIIGAFVYKELSWKQLIECFSNTLSTSAMVMLIIGAASAFGWMVTVTNVSSTIAGFILGISTNKYIVLAMIIVALILIGCVMDTTSAIVVFQTVFIPIAASLNMDMLYFGVLFIVVVAIGNATPPFGYSLFVASKISGEPLDRVSKNVIPMCIFMFAGVVLLVLFPQLCTMLPYAMK